MKKKVTYLLLSAFLLTMCTQELLIARSLNLPNKYSLAVIPFSLKGRVPASASKELAVRMQEELRRKNLFTIMDQVQVESTLRANNILPANCSSLQCGLDAGRRLGVQLVVNGNVRMVGTTYFIDVQMIHVGSGRVVNSYQGEVDGQMAELQAYMPVLANQLVGRAGQAGSTPATGSQTRSESFDVGSSSPGSMFEIGDSNRQQESKRGGSGAKWAVIGLLVAGGAATGIYFATKGGDENPGTGPGPGGQLPGQPPFPSN